MLEMRQKEIDVLDQNLTLRERELGVHVAEVLAALARMAAGLRCGCGSCKMCSASGVL